MSKKFLGVLLIAVFVVVAMASLVGCSGGVSGRGGKYYLEKSDGTLDESSWIELQKGGKWLDDEGSGGKYKVKGTVIEFYIDEIPDEAFVIGTLEDGILTLDLLGIGIVDVFRKEAEAVGSA